jgi:hypothetical protein
MLAEAKEIPVFCRFKQFGRNYVSRCYTSSNHPMVQLPEKLSMLVDNPGRGEDEKPGISEYYKEVNPPGHTLQSGDCPLPSTTHMKASSTRPGYLSTGEDK